MKRKLLILPLVFILLMACMIPTWASETTNGVAVTESVGAPGKKIKVKVSVEDIFADNIGVAITYDKELLTLSDESAWLLEEGTSDVNTRYGIAVWGIEDGIDVKGEVLELVFVASENAQIGTTTTVTCKVFAKWKNEVVLGDGENGVVTPVEASGVVTFSDAFAKLTGTVTSYGSATAAVTVELLDEEGTVIDTQILENGAKDYEFDIEQATYVVRVSKTKHCTREYEVVIEEVEDTVQDAEILLYGDVNGDGKIAAVDARQAMLYVAKKDSVLTGAEQYLLDVADVTGDGKVAAVDARNIMLYVAKKESVIDKLA